MSYGTVGFMNAVLMNNRKLLSQRERLKTTLGGFTPEIQEYDFPESTPQILREIRWRLREENTKRERRIMIVFSLVMLVLILGLFYLNTNYNINVISLIRSFILFIILFIHSVLSFSPFISYAYI